MSLINQMLQDLETRPAEHEAPGPLQTRAVRAAPLKPARDRLSLVLGVLALAGFTATAYVAWQRWQVTAAGKATEIPPQLSMHIDAALLPLALDERPPLPLAPEAPSAAAPAAPAAPVPAAPAPAPAPSAGTGAPVSGASAGTTPPAVAKAAEEAMARPREPSTREKADAELQRGQALARQGNGEQALAAFEKALQIDPAYQAARESLARALVEAKKPEQAMARLQEGLDENRAASSLAMMLARLQLERGNTRAAIDTLARSLPYDQGRPDYQAFMAGLLQKEERHREAIDYYLAALRGAPQNANWWMGIGISLQADQRPAEAREAYQRALALGSLASNLQAFVQQRLEQLR